MGDAQRRADLKTRIERLATYIESRDAQNAQLEDLEVRLNQFEKQFAAFEESHQEVVANTVETDDDANRLNTEIMEEVEETFMRTKANFVRRLNALRNPPPSTLTSTPTPPNSPNSRSPNTTPNNPQTHAGSAASNQSDLNASAIAFNPATTNSGDLTQFGASSLPLSSALDNGGRSVRESGSNLSVTIDNQG